MDDLPDAAARARAVDPAHNVVLEASAGTGKTHVLVDRYLNLLSRGVDPGNILAITFTRKAAAEMRGRILNELSRRAESRGPDRRLWRDLRERSGDVAISTIDAFCLSLLREFPLEANLDPGFEMADETQVPRLMDEALDRALDISRGLSRSDDDVRLLFAELRERRLRDALATMLERRLVVDEVLDRALESGPRDLTAERACEQAFERLRNVFNGLTGGHRRVSRQRAGPAPAVGDLRRRHADDCRRCRAGAWARARRSGSRGVALPEQGERASAALRAVLGQRLPIGGRVERFTGTMSLPSAEMWPAC